MMYICVHSKVLFIYLNIEENTISVEIVENESYLHNLLPLSDSSKIDNHFSLHSFKGEGDTVKLASCSISVKI